MKSSALNRIIITLAGIVLAGLVLVLFVIRPLLSGVEDVQTQTADTAARIKILDSEIKSYQTAIEELRRVKEGRARVEAMFPVREGLVSLVEPLEEALGASGVSWELDITDTETPEFGRELQERGADTEKREPVVRGVKNLSEVPYQLIVTGNFRQLTDFFLRFDHLSFISEVEKITLNAESRQDEVQRVLRNTGQGTARINAIFFIRDK